MIKIKSKYILLYLIGTSLLVFGNRQFWEKFQEEEKKKLEEEKLAKQAKVESYRKFETQNLIFDKKNKVWKNNHISFNTISVGKVSFPPIPKEGSVKKETNDDENASESL